MGRTIEGMINARKDAFVIAGIDIGGGQGAAYPIFENADCFNGSADVLIDFSHPSALDGTLKIAVTNKIPAVIATTGLSAVQVEAIREASKSVPVFFSANMSLGINLLIDLVRRAARVLEDDFDIEIVEKHHNQKIDAPSGTALAIADEISDVLKSKPEYVFDRHSERRKRNKNEIGFHAVRGGNIIGDHDVLFAGHNEMIEISHSATSRDVFADGAIKAAFFVSQQKPGFYNMGDLVNSY